MKFRIPLALVTGMVVLTTIVMVGSTLFASGTKAEGDIDRIGPQETRDLVESGRALLICSYSDQRCQSLLLKGALLLSELDARVAGLPKDQTLIFYCS